MATSRSKTSETQSALLQAALETQRGGHPMLDSMLKSNEPVSRETYLAELGLESPTAEEEQELPYPLRKDFKLESIKLPEGAPPPPLRNQFPDQATFEEAKNRWVSVVGRALAPTSRDSQDR